MGWWKARGKPFQPFEAVYGQADRYLGRKVSVRGLLVHTIEPWMTSDDRGEAWDRGERVLLEIGERGIEHLERWLPLRLDAIGSYIAPVRVIGTLQRAAPGLVLTELRTCQVRGGFRWRRVELRR